MFFFEFVPLGLSCFLAAFTSSEVLVVGTTVGCPLKSWLVPAGFFPVNIFLGGDHLTQIELSHFGLALLVS